MKIFSDIGAQLPQSFFIDEFDRLNEMEGISTESQRGVYFDYFIGLLFAQMDGVNIFVKKPTREGEVDVLVECIEGPEWLRRIVGIITPVENKWESGPVAKREITVFHEKAEHLALKSHCIASYFISMSGFSSDAENALDRCEEPNVIPLGKEDVEEMVDDGDPSMVLRQNFL